jgi:GntR family transcriptional repressor for pyruvate dehydrogenase complex
LLEDGAYGSGDRLPAISEMARRFHVGHPTLREALKKLEAMGVVSVRHGSGVYVAEHRNALFVSNPILAGTPTKKLLLDLIQARILIEVESVALAAERAAPHHLARMEELLARAEQHLGDDAVLNPTNMAFHGEIAAASGNAVIHQLLQVLASLFRHEQQVIMNIYGSRRKDHEEHWEILRALVERDAGRAAALMRAHLEGVRDVLRRWDPQAAPLPPAGPPRG